MDALQPSDLYDYRTAAQPAVSPSGDRVAYVVEGFDPDEDERRASLFVAPTDGSRDPHRLTRVADASQPKWSPGGERLAFVAAREEDVARRVGRDETDEATEEDGTESERGDDDGPTPQVWLFDLHRGGDAQQVTDFEEGVREFDWGPGGERIVVSARDPTDEQREYLDELEESGPVEIERLQHKANGVGWLDGVTTYLFVVDVDGGERDRLDDAYGQGAREPVMGLQPAWGPGGRIAFASNRTERPDDSEAICLYTIDPSGEDLRRVTDESQRALGYEWAPDGERLAFLVGEPTNWYAPNELHVGRDDPGAHASVTPDLDRTVVLPPRWADVDRDGTDEVVAGVGDGGLTRLVRSDPAAGHAERTFGAQGPTANWRTSTSAATRSSPCSTTRRGDTSCTPPASPTWTTPRRPSPGSTLRRRPCSTTGRCRTGSGSPSRTTTASRLKPTSTAPPRRETARSPRRRPRTATRSSRRSTGDR